MAGQINSSNHIPMSKTALREEGRPASKDRVLAVTADGVRQVYTVAEVAERADANGTWTTTLGNSTLHFHYRDDPETVVVTSEGSDAALQVIYAFWFAWHAMWPQDVPAQ